MFSSCVYRPLVLKDVQTLTGHIRTVDTINEDRRWRLRYKPMPQRIVLRTARRLKVTVPEKYRTNQVYMRRLVANLDKGVLHYTSYPIKELRGFLKARKIPLPARNIKGEVVKLLKADDRAPRFVRFLCLPPELRCIIYRYAMSFVGRMDISYYGFPVQPAVTRVSKAIREEALQVFYQFPSFTLKCRPGDHDYLTLPKPILNATTRKFLYAVDNSEHLRKAKVFVLKLGFDSHTELVRINAQISTQTRTVTKFRQTPDVLEAPAGTLSVRQLAEAVETIKSALKDFASMYENGLTGSAVSTWMLDTTTKIFPRGVDLDDPEYDIGIRLHIV